MRAAQIKERLKARKPVLGLHIPLPSAQLVEMAAYIGLKTRGVRGAMVSYIGFGLPAFVLILAVSFAYARTQRLPAVVSSSMVFRRSLSPLWPMQP